MSRGPESIERAIKELMRARSDDMLTVSDMARAAYPGIRRIALEHRIAVIRAAECVIHRLPGWDTVGRRQRPAGELVYCNMLNLRSYALAKIRVDSAANSIPDDELREMVDSGVKPESSGLEPLLDLMRQRHAWWYHVEINKAEHESRDIDAATLRAQLGELMAA